KKQQRNRCPAITGVTLDFVPSGLSWSGLGRAFVSAVSGTPRFKPGLDFDNHWRQTSAADGKSAMRPQHVGESSSPRSKVLVTARARRRPERGTWLPAQRANYSG